MLTIYEMTSDFTVCGTGYDGREWQHTLYTGEILTSTEKAYWEYVSGEELPIALETQVSEESLNQICTDILGHRIQKSLAYWLILKAQEEEIRVSDYRARTMIVWTEEEPWIDIINNVVYHKGEGMTYWQANNIQDEYKSRKDWHRYETLLFRNGWKEVTAYQWEIEAIDVNSGKYRVRY